VRGRGGLVLLLLGACEVHPYCLDCIDSTPDSGGAEGAPDGGIAVATDGCIAAGAEQCNGIDDDCNGRIDDGAISGVGVACGTDTGPCVAGVTECVGGLVVCTGNTGAARPEECNNVDDDCNGVVDNGNPGGGASCGSDVGSCAKGMEVCDNGAVACVGSVGPAVESCNAQDDDCDGLIDEGNPEGGAACLPPGTCVAGTLACQGGALACVGATGPSPESCDGVDNDCDGATDEDYDLLADPMHCGNCGTRCSAANGQAACVGGSCAVAFCLADWWDLNGDPVDGCEYGCQFRGSEICNDLDDDCDGSTNEDLVAPPLCSQVGECAGTTATCGATGWTCAYPGTVQTDGGGGIVPESACDGLDEDCDGVTDDPFPTLGQSCTRGLGACATSGAMACTAAMDGVECSAPDPQPGQPETCNGQDDDCDAQTDEDAADEWVAISGGFGARWIYKYEASHPDASASVAGVMTHRSCSVVGRLPWTNVTYPQAQAACSAIGARLCTEAEWQRACETGAPTPCPWSYAAACDTFSAATCNGNDYDFDTGTAGDQDGMLAAGALPACYADWGTAADRVFDLSGNAKEWTEARSPGVNPLRGGSYNNTAQGISCAFDFAVGDDAFLFENVGFRCCRDTAP